MCLLGIPCRYDGKVIEDITDVIGKYPKVNFIPVCPEQLGGMTTPRKPSEIVIRAGDDGINFQTKVVNKSGVDVTSNFIKGAECVLALAKKYSAKIFIGVPRSPSCSCLEIYNGNFE